MKNINKSFLISGLLLLCACSYFPVIGQNRVVQPLVKNPTSVVVCREKQCAPARLSMSQEYIYNSLTQLLQNNKGTKALLCTADAASHICTEEFLMMPIKVGIVPANMYIDNVKITDVRVYKGTPKLDLVLNYNVTYNGQTPICKPSRTMAFVESADSIMMEDDGYSCKMTTIGNSIVKTMFAIDYIDLDYGYIGGYYSIGVSGPANGGGAGYMLIRLPANAYPLSPALTFNIGGPALRREVMIKGIPNMSFNNQGSASMKVFPIYTKKNEAKVKVEPEKTENTTKATEPTEKKAEPTDKKAEAGSTLKENVSDKK